MNSTNRQKLLKDLKRRGLEIEKEQKRRNFRVLSLPYNIEKGDRCVYRNDAVHFNTIDTKLLPKQKQIEFFEETLLGRSVKKTEIKYRDNEIPMLSVELRVSIIEEFCWRSTLN